MNPIEKTYITDKLVNALHEAAGLVTPEQRYAIYQDAMRLIGVLLKGSKPLSVYRELFPTVTFTESENGLDVFPPDNVSMSRVEAIDWRNKLLVDGLGQLTLFRVRYAAGGYVEYAGESEESQVLERLIAAWGVTWKVFRTAENKVINLVQKTPFALTEATNLANSVADIIKSQYPFEVIVVRVPVSEPEEGGVTEVRVVKR